MKATLPADEAQRLGALRSFDILDTPPELSYDDMTALASHICGTPIALVSLIDASRQWFKSKVGLDVRETPRELAFCAHAILASDELMEVADALDDPRFEHNALVTGAPHIRFYAGMPLVAGGHALGTLCVIDRVPRVLDETQRRALRALARQVSTLIESRRVMLSLQSAKTELTALNSQLRVALKQAERANRTKSVFLSTMSHELRTPLNSILGFTGIVLQEMAGPLNAEQRKQLSMVQNSARHLLGLVMDVLDISKIEAGEMRLTVGVFDMDEVIEAALGAARATSQGKGIELCRAGGAVGLARGDRHRVGQILHKLLDNALRFTDQGVVTVCATRQAAAVAVEVADTGMGIAPQDLAHLFEPFQQVDTSLARQHDGAGLGLAICQRLAALMSGAVQVVSESGVGSRFTLTLPLPHGPAAGAGVATESGP